MFDNGVFSGLEETLIALLKSILEPVTADFSIMMGTLFTASYVGCFICWKGFQTVFGRLDSPVSAVMWDVFRILLVVAVATNAGGSLDRIVGAFEAIRNGIVGGESIWSALDNLWHTTNELAETFLSLDESKFFKATGILGMVATWVATLVLTGVIGFTALMAEATALLLITISPIVIFLLQFPWFISTFTNWLQALTATVFTTLFCGLVAKAAIGIYTKAIAYANDQVDKFGADVGILGTSLMILVVGVLIAYLMRHFAGMAGSIAGSSVERGMQGIVSMATTAAGVAGAKVAAEGVKKLFGDKDPGKSDSANTQGGTGGNSGASATSQRQNAMNNMMATARDLNGKNADGSPKAKPTSKGASGAGSTGASKPNYKSAANDSKPPRGALKVIQGSKPH